VELSEDGGATWAGAVLDPQHDPYEWRLWAFRNPGGFLHNGWHSVEIDVSR
jgi:hypothetical protein